LGTPGGFCHLRPGWINRQWLAALEGNVGTFEEAVMNTWIWLGICWLVYDGTIFITDWIYRKNQGSLEIFPLISCFLSLPAI